MLLNEEPITALAPEGRDVGSRSKSVVPMFFVSPGGTGYGVHALNMPPRWGSEEMQRGSPHATNIPLLRS
jgi:hypothetical protein